jgi:hypothetical protein
VIWRLAQRRGLLQDLGKPRRGSACARAPATLQCHATEVAVMVGEVAASALGHRRTRILVVGLRGPSARNAHRHARTRSVGEGGIGLPNSLAKSCRGAAE